MHSRELRNSSSPGCKIMVSLLGKATFFSLSHGARAQTLTDGYTGTSSVFTTPSLPCLLLLFWEGPLAEDRGMGHWKKAFREDSDSLSTVLQ